MLLTQEQFDKIAGPLAKHCGFTVTTCNLNQFTNRHTYPRNNSLEITVKHYKQSGKERHFVRLLNAKLKPKG